MLLNTGTELVQSSHGLLSTLAYRLGGTAAPHYALEGSIAIAGQGISWLRDRMGFIGSAGEGGVRGRACVLVACAPARGWGLQGCSRQAQAGRHRRRQLH